MSAAGLCTKVSLCMVMHESRLLALGISCTSWFIVLCMPLCLLAPSKRTGINPHTYASNFVQKYYTRNVYGDMFSSFPDTSKLLVHHVRVCSMLLGCLLLSVCPWLALYLGAVALLIRCNTVTIDEPAKHTLLQVHP